MAITDANTVLLHTLGRSPTVADVAAHLGLTEEEVLEGLEGARAYAATSLSTPVSADQSMELGDTLGSDDNGYEAAELHMMLGDALQTLDDREQKILSMRFYGNQTQTEIASQIGISQMHVSRLITRALAKLRVEISAD